jgi:hypothetical protein
MCANGKDCQKCTCSTSAWFGVHSSGTAIDAQTKQPIKICVKCGTRL